AQVAASRNSVQNSKHMARGATASNPRPARSSNLASRDAWRRYRFAVTVRDRCSTGVAVTTTTSVELELSWANAGTGQRHRPHNARRFTNHDHIPFAVTLAAVCRFGQGTRKHVQTALTRERPDSPERQSHLHGPAFDAHG